jgi:glyoxylase-like metal-dependent hydrolase (beta-lactamase superfamily II)
LDRTIKWVAPEGVPSSRRDRYGEPMTEVHNLAAEADAFTSNVFLVTGDRTALVDVGDGFDVGSEVRRHVDSLDAVVLTHTHPDHVGSVDAVRSAFGVETLGWDPTQPAVDAELGETIRLGDHDYRVLHTPGHKDDHVALHAPESGRCFGGDLVFANGAFGRTDLAEGDRERLIRSIERLLSAVGSDLVALHPGHGPSVTVDPTATVERAREAARRRP